MGPGEDGDAHALHDAGVQAQLVENALDLVGAGLLDGDVGGAVFVDGADGALDGAADRSIGQHALVVLDLGLERIFVIGGLGQICGDGPQLQLQGGLDALVLFLLYLVLQILLLGGQILDLLLELVQLQLLLVDGQAQGVGVILEELLIDPDLVADGDVKLLDLLLGVPVDLNHVLADDHTGEFIGAGGGGGQHAGLLHVDLGLPAAAGQTEHQSSTQGDHGFLHVHREVPPFRFPYDIVIIIRFFQGRVNRCNYKEL